MSRVVVITAPGSIISLEEAKQHLRVDHDIDDALITGLVAAAQQHIDGPEGWLGRAIGRQTLELRQCGFPQSVIALPFPPHHEIAEVTYDDSLGAAQTLPPASYKLYGRELMPAPGMSWPATAGTPE
ncbi:head-tail connector protein, partial [Lysobacter sp. TAB13]|uniref:head-tail connector protein n=1 Tax=Lysobacter sp. TAB13 TaxID=3233065 RepID=UPI003F980723